MNQVGPLGARIKQIQTLRKRDVEAIRQSLVEMYGNEIGEQVRILYGGSVNPENIGQIMSKPNVDGALIGRASLEIESFLQMINYIELASKQKLQVI